MRETASGQEVVRLILRHFSSLRDPRAQRTRKYALPHVLAMALCAVLMGADGFAAIALLVRDRRALFETWLAADFGEGTPCTDTFRRVFGALCPQGFERAFRHFIAALARSLQGQVVALDGKAVRGALVSDKGPLHLVHVWAAEQRLLLAQRRVEGAPGEVSGLVELIDALALEGACVTADANGCTEGVAAACTRAQADYVLCLKGNRGPQRRLVHRLFLTAALLGQLPAPGGRSARAARTLGQGHGRTEERLAWALPLSPALQAKLGFVGVRTAVLVRRTRRTADGREATEWHTYLTSLAPNARRLLHVIRSHWGVENGLHWRLDVGYGEDRRRTRHACLGENLARVHRLSLGLLQRERSERAGIALKRQMAGWSEDYLLKVLSAGVP